MVRTVIRYCTVFVLAVLILTAEVIKIDEAAIPLADVAEITASDESLFKKDEWEAC